MGGYRTKTKHRNRSGGVWRVEGGSPQDQSSEIDLVGVGGGSPKAKSNHSRLADEAGDGLEATKHKPAELLFPGYGRGSAGFHEIIGFSSCFALGNGDRVAVVLRRTKLSLSSCGKIDFLNSGFLIVGNIGVLLW